MRAGARVFFGSCGVGFDASNGPRAGSVFWQSAHSGATGGGFRLSAAAGADVGARLVESGGSVGQDREDEQTGGKKKIEPEPKKNSAKTRERRSSHGEEFPSEGEKNR